MIRVEPKPLEKPASTSGESVANSIWAKAALPMRLPLRLLVALLAGERARSPLEDWPPSPALGSRRVAVVLRQGGVAPSIGK